MGLEKKINQDLIIAMKEKDSWLIETLRSVKTSFKTAKVLNKTTDELSDDQAIQVLQKMLKQRNDSFEIYKNANRLDLAEKEQVEGVIIFNYLPVEIPDEDLKLIVSNLSKSNMGQMIKEAKEKVVSLSFIVDGKKLASFVKEKLST